MTNRFLCLSVAGILCVLVLCYYQKDGVFPSTPLAPPPPSQIRAIRPACRSLFMITAPSPRAINTTSLPGSVDLRRTPHLIAPRLGGFQDSPHIASATVQKTVKNRQSFGRISTSDYENLAKLLPRLLFSGNVSKLEEEMTRQIVNKDETKTSQYHKKIKIKLPSPFLLGGSRIEAAGGVLPYVPCLIASYSDPTNFYTCAKRRLQNGSPLWLYFMGDSKIRDLFDEFLTLTDPACNYIVSYWNLSNPWPAVRKNLFFLRWSDMEATTPALLGMRVTYTKFYSMEPSRLNDTQEITQLRLWASGGEPPPNLLVIGYSTWMMLWHKNANKLGILDFLDGLRQMHSLVMPLLQKISQRTRVLVLCQSRFRPYSDASLKQRGALTPANFDWSEATALYFLRHGAEVNPYATIVQSALLLDNLISTSSHSDVWWWDSGLPLSLAAHQECEELHRLKLTHHPVYRDSFLSCHDPHHAGRLANTDLVVMLLNMICNSVLQLDQRHCCS